jgi:hypothetical protein
MIAGHAYDVALLIAETMTYSDYMCTPTDWAQTLALYFQVMTREWSSLVANLPVMPDKLPACRVQTEQPPPFAVDVSGLRPKMAGLVESAMTPTGSDAEAVTFTLANDMGTLKVTGLSASGRAVLDRGRWVRYWPSYSTSPFAIFDGQGGSLLASADEGFLQVGVWRPGSLDVTVLVEPRCVLCQDWKLYDVVYDDSPNHRVPSHERTVITSGGRTFDAWIGVGVPYSTSFKLAYLAME